MRVQWRQKRVDEIKKRVLQEITAMKSAHTPARVRDVLLQKIAFLEDSNDTNHDIERFIWIVTALNHHRHTELLSSSQIKKLKEIAYALLLVNGVKPGSTLGYLFGELHFMLADIDAMAGDHLGAAWERQLCRQLSGKKLPGGKGLNLLQMGLHAMTLGDPQMALGYLRLAEEANLQGLNSHKARLARLRALRLSGQHLDAEKLAVASRDFGGVSEEFLLEWQWEQFCIQAMLSPREGATSMISGVKRGRSHHGSSYILEAYLWVASVQNQELMERLPRLTSLAKHKDLKLRHHPLYKFTNTIYDCYDTESPLVTRINAVKSLLPTINKLQHVDKKLLIYLAISRWLSRWQLADLTRLVFSQYRNLSLSMSGGKSGDVLGVGQDLEAKYTVRVDTPLDKDDDQQVAVFSGEEKSS